MKSSIQTLSRFANIPTKYNGINFRSRLEARWAAFFDQLKWEWEYEPIDLNGWIPDFTTNPIQAIHTKHFYVRAGSSFMPAPYQVLAGMFGRKPQPRVYHMYTIGPAILENQTIKTHTGLLINNEGPGIAKDVFINANIYSSPGPNCEIGFETPDLKDWSGGFSFGRFLYLISKNDVRIPPEAHLQPVIIRANFTPPFDKDLIIEITAGCEGAPPMKGKLYSTKKNIEEVYAKYVSSHPALS